MSASIAPGYVELRRLALAWRRDGYYTTEVDLDALIGLVDDLERRTSELDREREECALVVERLMAALDQET